MHVEVLIASFCVCLFCFLHDCTLWMNQLAPGRIGTLLCICHLKLHDYKRRHLFRVGRLGASVVIASGFLVKLLVASSGSLLRSFIRVCFRLPCLCVKSFCFKHVHGVPKKTFSDAAAGTSRHRELSYPQASLGLLLCLPRAFWGNLCSGTISDASKKDVHTLRYFSCSTKIRSLLPLQGTPWAAAGKAPEAL